MKILFTIAVLIAGVYLFLPQSELKKLALFLPQNQIKQAAETVLSDVDQKLEQFKVKLLLNKDSRINELEKQIASLQKKINLQEEKYNSFTLQNDTKILPALPVEKSLAKTQYIAKALPQVQRDVPQNFAPSNTDMSTNNADKQQAMKRQAYLQDLAERMNKTSLTALTH